MNIPKQINISDFKYFVVFPDLMVAGVFAEDENDIYIVFLKGQAYPVGKTGKNSKKNISDQVLAGIAYIIKSYEEAMSFDITNALSTELLNYIEKQKEKEND